MEETYPCVCCDKEMTLDEVNEGCDGWVCDECEEELSSDAEEDSLADDEEDSLADLKNKCETVRPDEFKKFLMEAMMKEWSLPHGESGEVGSVEDLSKPHQGWSYVYLPLDKILVKGVITELVKLNEERGKSIVGVSYTKTSFKIKNETREAMVYGEDFILVENNCGCGCECGGHV